MSQNTGNIIWPQFNFFILEKALNNIYAHSLRTFESIIKIQIVKQDSKVKSVNQMNVFSTSRINFTHYCASKSTIQKFGVSKLLFFKYIYK